MITETAAFTRYGIYFKPFDGIKAAQFLTQPAPRTSVGVNVGDLPAPELAVLFHQRFEQQVKVGRIHIAVIQYLSFRQGCQRGDDAGLPGTAFTA
jgi:hypothetical protein